GLPAVVGVGDAAVVGVEGAGQAVPGAQRHVAQVLPAVEREAGGRDGGDLDVVELAAGEHLGGVATAVGDHPVEGHAVGQVGVGTEGQHIAAPVPAHAAGRVEADP